MGKEINKKRCVIIGSAPIDQPELLKPKLRENDYIICADGGVQTAQRMSVTPDLIIGDFDSITVALPEHIETITLPVCKDDTDMMYSVKEGLHRGFDDFLILGGTGGRLDHTFANLCALQYLAAHNARNILSDLQNDAFVVQSGEINFVNKVGSLLSVFPIGSSFCRVSYEGLQYPLIKAELHSSNPMGVSNCIQCDHAKIIVHEGPVLIILSKDL